MRGGIACNNGGGVPTLPPRETLLSLAIAFLSPLRPSLSLRSPILVTMMATTKLPVRRQRQGTSVTRCRPLPLFCVSCHSLSHVVASCGGDGVLDDDSESSSCGRDGLQGRRQG
ncbi:uncharacterized protein DS421_16g561300 [Arachis hypogaea]|nr:uncharacterized protein DS421_16g561300 [Arachis hypogaea]